MIVALAAYIGYCIGFFIIQVVFRTLLLMGMALFVMLKYSVKMIVWTGKLLGIIASLVYTKAYLLYQSRFKAQEERAFVR
mgnify:FL=1|jgi:hypothetical protein